MTSKTMLDRWKLDSIGFRIEKHRPGGQEHDQDKHGDRDGAGGGTGTQDRLFESPRADLSAIFDFDSMMKQTDRYYSGEYPDEAQYQFEEMLEGDWVQWQGARDIRGAATDLLERSLDDGDIEIVDPHQDRSSPYGHHDRGASAPELQAQYMLEHLMRPEWSTRTGELYRAFTLTGDQEEAFLSTLQPGEEIDFPLLSFATERTIGDHEVLDGFGTDALFVLEAGATSYDFEDPITAPRYGEGDEYTFLNDWDIGLGDWISESESDGEFETAKYYSEIREMIGNIKNDPGSSTTERQDVASFFQDMGVAPKMAGVEITEELDADAFYEWFDYPPSYAPREVVSGGRFKVKDVSPDPRGTFSNVITIEQIGVFDPWSKKFVTTEDLPDA